MCGNSLIIRSASQILPGRWPAGNADVPGTAYVSALSFGSICSMCTASRHTPTVPLGGLLKRGRFLRSPRANIPGEATPTPDTPAGHAHPRPTGWPRPSQTHQLATPTPRLTGWPRPLPDTRLRFQMDTLSPHHTPIGKSSIFISFHLANISVFFKNASGSL